MLEPTVATYNAYAATLLTDHGLRIGHEPDTRVVTDAARYQLGARVVDRHTGEVEHLTDHPPTAIQNLLALDGAMSRAPGLSGAGARVRRRGPGGLRPGDRGRTGRQGPQDLPRSRREGRLRDRPARRAARPGRGISGPEGRPLADGLLRPDRARGPAGLRAARGRGDRARPFQGGPARRVPGHLGGPGRAARRGCSRVPTRRPAGDTRSPRSAIPTRRSTAGAEPRCPTSSTSPTRSPPRPALEQATRCRPSR